MGQLEVGIQTHRALESLLGPAQIVGQKIGHAQVVVERRGAGLQLYGLVEGGDGLLRLPALVVDDAQGALSPPQRGIHASSLAQGAESLFLAALPQIGQPHALVGYGVPGLFTVELLEDRLCLYELAVAQAGLGHLGPQAVVIFLGGQ